MVNVKHREKVFKLIDNMNSDDNLKEKIKILKRVLNFFEEYDDVRLTEANYEEIKNQIMKKIKYKVAIFGESIMYIKLVMEILEMKKVELIGIYDKIETEKKIKDIIVKPVAELNNIEIDYIINVKDGINDEKIISFYNYLYYNYNYEMNKGYYDYKENIENKKIFLAGTSSHEIGILSNISNIKIINMGVSMQDIFYSKKLIEYALINDINNKIDKYIIGLFHQSFGYDLSKDPNRTISYRANMYYELTKDLHNFVYKEEMIKHYNNFIAGANNIFIKDFSKKIYEQTKENNEVLIEYLRGKEYNRFNLSKAELEVEQESIKKYLELIDDNIIQENLELMKTLLKSLNSKNIKPIILICPMAEIWRKMSKEYPATRNIFNECIEQLKKDFEFDLYDYFDRKEFSDNDFYDVSHLNIKGSKKFTKMFALDSGIGLKE